MSFLIISKFDQVPIKIRLVFPGQKFPHCIGRLRKSGVQKIDIKSLLLNKFS